MSYGLVVVSDTGTAIINGDSPSFEYFGAFDATAISGNVHTFAIDTGGWLPLCFLKVPDGKSGSILSMEKDNSVFTIVALMDFTDKLYIFRVVHGTPTGFGLAAWGSNGALIYDSHSTMLNVRKIEACGFSLSAISDGNNMTLFNGGSVRPHSSVSYFDGVAGVTVQYRSVTTYEAFTNQHYEWRDYQSYESVCSWQYVNGYNTYVCSYQWVTRQRMEMVDFTDWHWVTRNYTDWYYVYAHVKKTDWYIDRSVVKRSGDSYLVDWMRHETGYYNEVVSGYTVYWYSSGNLGNAAPAQSGLGFNDLIGLGGDISTTCMALDAEHTGGHFDKNNTFPYANSNYNVEDANIIFLDGSDYV